MYGAIRKADKAMPELGLAQTVAALETRYPALTESYEQYAELSVGAQNFQKPVQIQDGAAKPESK